MNSQPNYCTLYIIRHAQSEGNLTKIFGGNPQLTDLGRVQAREISQQLKNIDFHAVFSSDLFRAKETAEIIASEKKLTVLTKEALRERYYGKTEGQELSQELRDELSKLLQEDEDQVWKHHIADDDETNEEALARVITHLREIAVGYPNQTVLVVSHANVIRNLLVHLGFAKHSELRSGSVVNTGYVKLKCDGVDFFIEETWGVNKQ